MRKLLIYKSGERYFMDGMTIGLHQGELEKEYDLSKATQEQIERIRKNPYDNSLLAEFSKTS